MLGCAMTMPMEIIMIDPAEIYLSFHIFACVSMSMEIIMIDPPEIYLRFHILLVWRLRCASST
eukprot:COSAG01_NODE_3828_length_5655_cov_3.721742_7_plen_63_part_00